jgi:ABC-type transporter Mla maintaining outer membrane lipid asymmetry permease subunit MlaE
MNFNFYYCTPSYELKNLTVNKIRIIGLLILIIGFVIKFFLENDLDNFISAILIGIGIGLCLTGKVRRQTK